MKVIDVSNWSARMREPMENMYGKVSKFEILKTTTVEKNLKFYLFFDCIISSNFISGEFSNFVERIY